MTDELRLAQLLQSFQNDLNELGIATEYLDTAPDRPTPSLIVQAPDDEHGHERSVLLAFIPDDGEIEEFDMLHLYMLIPVTQPGDDIAKRLVQINATAVLGHGGVTESGEIHWRHVWPMPRGLPIIPAVLFEVLQLFVFAAQLCTSALAPTGSD